MGKKNAPAGAPLWMVTYSDMVTLLLTFFVLLLAMANFEDIQRVDAVLGSIQASLGMGSREVSGSATGDAMEEGLEADSQAEADFHNLRAQLDVALSAQLSNDLIKLTQEQTEIRITLSDRILFAPGSAELHPVAYRMVSDTPTGPAAPRRTGRSPPSAPWRSWSPCRSGEPSMGSTSRRPPWASTTPRTWSGAPLTGTAASRSSFEPERAPPMRRSSSLKEACDGSV